MTTKRNDSAGHERGLLTTSELDARQRAVALVQYADGLDEGGGVYSNVAGRIRIVAQDSLAALRSVEAERSMCRAMDQNRDTLLSLLAGRHEQLRRAEHEVERLKRRQQ